MSDQQGKYERSQDEKDELIAHLRRQEAFAINQMIDAQQAAARIRWRAGSDRLLIDAWHAINDSIDDYGALQSVSDRIEEHLGYHGLRCYGCDKACLAGADGEDLFLRSNWCQECEDRKHNNLLSTLGVV